MHLLNMSIAEVLHSFAPPTYFNFRANPASGAQYPVVAIIVYLGTIFTLQHVMRARSPMRLTLFAFAHNVFLCALSVAMLLGTLYELARVALAGGGFVNSIMCDRQHAAMTGRLGFWMYIFYVSKVRFPHLIVVYLLFSLSLLSLYFLFMISADFFYCGSDIFSRHFRMIISYFVNDCSSMSLCRDNPKLHFTWSTVLRTFGHCDHGT